MNALFLYCRVGFEKDCAAEITDKAAQLGVSGYCKTKPQSGYVVFSAIESAQMASLHQQLPVYQYLLRLPISLRIIVFFSGRHLAINEFT